jgi:hypothetical protein
VTGLRTLPVIGDYLDARGAERPIARLTQQLPAIAALAGLGWLSQIPEPLRRALGELAGHLVWLVLPVAIAAACLYALCARERGAAPEPSYRFRQAVRNTAKIALPIAAILTAQRISVARPTIGQVAIEGYVCDPSGRPINDGTLYVVDAANRRASEPDGPDRAGAFYLPIARGSFRPLSIWLSAPGCPAARLTSLDAAQTPAAVEGCPTATAIARRDSIGRRLPGWTVPRCEP